MSYKETKTLLYINDVSLGYDGKTILKNINFDIKDIVREGHDATGQVIAFLGRSGRGKSTLFKGLTGLLKPTQGQILITDLTTEDDDDAKPLSEGDMGFVDQKYTLFRHKTIWGICEYALRKSKATRGEKEGLISEYLIDWGLIAHKDKYPSELSGGQRQRTAIIEQILTSKHFMILDEPFASLDIKNIENVKDSFKRISEADELNTIIFSTHDINIAVELADVIYIIGYPEDDTSYSTILKHYDLKSMGLAWQPYGDGHRKLVTDIKELIVRS
jgi:ABC-type nitrate/sulfonate/bicarbonate transport system ATPase subunit